MVTKKSKLRILWGSSSRTTAGSSDVTNTVLSSSFFGHFMEIRELHVVLVHEGMGFLFKIEFGKCR